MPIPQTTRRSIKIQADSGVYAEGDGYERTVLLSHRASDGSWVLVKAAIRVDRLPGNSSFVGSVWTSTCGWVEMHRLDTVNIWYLMPGFKRVNQMTTDIKTRRVAFQIAESVIDQL